MENSPATWLLQVVDTDEAERKMLEEIREMCVRAGAADRRTVTEAS